MLLHESLAKLAYTNWRDTPDVMGYAYPYPDWENLDETRKQEWIKKVKTT